MTSNGTGMIDGFRKFISRGNMIDMAVGVVMGGAVTGVVNSIVDHVINPLIAMAFGKPDMSGLLAVTFNGATISFGAVLGELLNFLVIGAAVYFGVLVPINKFRDMSEALLVKAKLKEAQEAAAAASRQTIRGMDVKASEGEAVDGDGAGDGASAARGTSQEAREAVVSTDAMNAKAVELLAEIRDQLAKMNGGADGQSR